MKIIIQSHSTVPIYEQIVESLKNHIVTKTINPGDPLPSIRQLAADLSVSVITTKRAYEELEKQGYITTLSSKGSYVSHLSDDFYKEKYLVEIEKKLEEISKLARLTEMSKEEIFRMYEFLEENQ